MQEAAFTEPIAGHLWTTRYRLAAEGRAAEAGIGASWQRVAQALSAAEGAESDLWRRRFEELLAQFRFLPGGRILSGAGSGRRQTLFSCFATGVLHDSIGGIFQTLAEAALTLQGGAAAGCDFSALRPAGTRALETGQVASGPLSFLYVWDRACEAVMSTSPRRGALLALLRADHPDIGQFINAKLHAQALRHVRLAVLVPDALMRAVENDEPWELLFPLGGRPLPQGAAVRERTWSGSVQAEPCVVTRTVRARALWEDLNRAAVETGEPGVVFIDRVERANNLYYCEAFSAVSAGGEAPLPPHGACDLGALNLAQFVTDPFGAHPRLEFEALGAAAGVATRLLDDVYEVSQFPLPAQQEAALASRRIGLGITGLADALAMLGVRYGSPVSVEVAGEAMRVVCHAAYRASAALAQERGAFPQYRQAQYLDGAFVRSLPPELADEVRAKGMRNSHLTAIAASHATSLLANNASSGIAPVALLRGQRSVRAADGSVTRVPVRDYACAMFSRRFGDDAPLPGYFVEAFDVPPADQLKLYAAVQAHVDQGIASPVELAPEADYDDAHSLLMQAWQLGLKGCRLERAGAAADSALAPPGELAQTG